MSERAEVKNRFLNVTKTDTYGGGLGFNLNFHNTSDGKLASMGLANLGADGAKYVSVDALSYIRQNFTQLDEELIYEQLGLAGFDQFKSSIRPPAEPRQAPAPTETQNSAPTEPTNTPSPNTPTSPTSNTSVSGQISPANTGSVSGGTQAQLNSLGWASFASQVQGTRLFNEVQSNIQNLLNSTGQGTAGNIVNSTLQGMQSGELSLGMSQQATSQYDMQNIRNGRKKIGYEQTKAFDQASAAAQLGKPTLIGT